MTTRTRRWLRATLLTGVVGILPSLSALADAPRPAKIYTTKTLLRLPVEIDEQSRASISEIRLFVRPPRGGWVMHTSGPATQSSFDYRTSGDGEYAFVFAIVSRNGTTTPSDVNLATPHRVVVVDTQPPTLTVSPISLSGGETVVQARMFDTNPKPESIRMIAQLANGNWQTLELISADTPGVYRLPDAKFIQGGLVRGTGTDLAGNPVTTETRLGAKVPADPSSINKITQTGTVAKVSPIEVPLIPPPPDPIRIPKEPTEIRTVSRSSTPRPPIIMDAPPKEPELPVGIALPTATPGPRKLPDSIEPPPAPDTSGTMPATIPVLNSTKLALDYRLDGPNTRIVFWMTRDKGRSWEKLNDENDGVSPAKLSLPGDGIYGILAKTSALGQSPGSRERIDTWVEVDTVKPEVKLGPVQPGKGAEAGTLLITWVAADQNLTATPITIAYATRPEGPWLPAAQNLRNDGSYRWTMPNGIGTSVYLRVEAVDRAGNIGRAEAKNPITLEGPKPRVRVLGVGPGE